MAEPGAKSPTERAKEMVEVLRQGSESFLTTKVDSAINWGRKYSMFLYPFVTACCGMEFMSAGGPRYDLGALIDARKTFTRYIAEVEADPVKKLEYADEVAEARASIAEIDSRIATKNLQIAEYYISVEREEAARLLGWGRNTLTRKIKALHLD